MKRFLLSILCCFLAVVSGYAEEGTTTESFTFSNFTAGTQYAKNEEHKLSNAVTIYTTDCHFTTQLRIYSSATNNGYVVSNQLPGVITKMTFNAGNKKDNLLIFGSNDGSSWTQVGQVAVTSTSYKDYEFNFTGEYTYFKLDVEGTNQIRLQSMSVTYQTSGSVTPPKETVATPVISPDAQEFNKGETLSVEISTTTEGATIHYTIDDTTPTEASAVYSTPISVSNTTTVKAIAVKEDYNNSEVAVVKYTMVDPNAVEKTGTISFASTTQRVSQDGNSQVWKNENITFTNNKSGSQNNVVSNVNPVRLYANSEIIIEAPGNITKIEFDCNTTAYATVLNNSITNGATASSDKVTVTLDGTSSSFTVQKLSAQVRLDALTVTYIIDEGTTIIPTLNSPIFSSGSCLFVNQIEVSITAEEGATILYCLNDEVPNVEYSEPIPITETTTIKAKAIKDGCNDSEVSEVTLTKVVVEEGQVVDKITRELTGAEENVYIDWSGITVTSSAVYAGNSAGGNNAIQLRSDKNESGIVTTVSGGKVKKIIVEWQGNTADGRTLNVYGKNGAYSDPTDLYDNTKYGDKLGSIVKGEQSTELEITRECTYVGLRSDDGAMYLTSIFIIWEVADEEPEQTYTLNVTAANYATLFLDYATVIPTGVKAYAVTEVNNGYVSLTPFEGILPAKTGAIIEAVEGDYAFVAAANNGSAISGNKLLGTTVNTNIPEDAYVLGMVDGVVGLYKAEMAGGVFLNNANKAYLPVSALTASAQGAKALKFRFDDQTTGINGVATGKKPEVIFDLYGRKVNNATAPGLYIINGKKVMVK